MTLPITKDQREELTRLREATTPGPWRFGGTTGEAFVMGDPDSDGWSEVALTPNPRSPLTGARHVGWRKDAVFIAAVHALTPAYEAALVASERERDSEALSAGLWKDRATAAEAEADRLRAALQEIIDGVGYQPGYLNEIGLQCARVALLPSDGGEGS